MLFIFQLNSLTLNRTSSILTTFELHLCYAFMHFLLDIIVMLCVAYLIVTFVDNV